MAFLWISVYIILHSPRVQTYLVHKASTLISDELETEVSIQSVDFTFFKTFILHDVLLKDKHNDTLAFIHHTHIGMSIFSIWEKKIVINDITLDNVKIDLHRDLKDSAFNYSFLLSKNKTNQNPSKNSWELKLENIALKGVLFTLRDSVEKTYIGSQITSTNISINDFDLKKKLNINAIEIENPKIVFNHYSQSKKDSLPFLIHYPFEFEVSSIDIRNGSFQHINTAYALSKTKFNPNNLTLNNINLVIEDINQSQDSLKASIVSLTAKDNSSVELQKFNTKLTLSNRRISLQGLELKTNHSDLNLSVDMRFHSLKDFENNLQNIQVSANIQKAKILAKDIDSYTNFHRAYKINEVKLSGKLKGNLHQISAKDLLLSIDNHTQIDADIDIKNISDISKSSIISKIRNIKTNTMSIRQALPTTIPIPPQVLSLGDINMVGEANGSLANLKTNITITTSIGSGNANLMAGIDPITKKAHYIGKINVQKVNLGKLLQNDSLFGNVTMDMELDGKGIKLDEFDSHLKGQISEFTFKNYTYRNITVNGDLTKKKFNGTIGLNDPNAVIQMNGTVQMEENVPSFLLQAKIDKINLDKLNLYPEPWTISSLINVNFKGKNIDDLDGEINLDDVVIKNNTNNKSYSIEYLTLNSDQNDHQKNLTIISDVLQAEFNGQFVFKDLPIVVNNYLLSYFHKHDAIELSQPTRFKFDISLENTKKILQLFVPKLKNINVANIKGNFNSDNKVMNILSNFEGLQYDDFTISNMIIKGKSNANTFMANSTIDSIFKKDSLLISPISITSNYQNNKLNFTIKGAPDKSDTRLRMNGEMTAYQGGVKVHILPSSLFINKKEWNFHPQNEIIWAKKDLTINKLLVKHKLEMLYITTNKTDGETNLNLRIKNINLRDIFTDLMKSDHPFYGNVNGNVTIKNALKNPAPIGDLNITKVIINKDTLGEINIKSEWLQAENKAVINGTIKGKYQDINIDGFYKANKGKDDEIALNVDIERLTPNFLDNFVSVYMYNNRGKLSGRLQVTGSPQKPLLTGFMNINYLETTVNVTHTKYFFKNQIARFTKDGISFDGVSFMDRFGNPAYGSGMIRHTNLKNFYLDVAIRSPKLECLHTTFAENPQWWGIVFAEATGKFQGYTDRLIDIDIKGKAIEGSDLSLLFGYQKEVEKYNFYNFKDKNPKKKIVENKNTFVLKSGVNIDVDVEVTRPCKLHIIFDPYAEDKINAEGVGNIKLRTKKNGEFTVLGDYKVENGDYLFTFKNVIKKRFLIKPGGMMSFIGDPYKSKINLEAIYRTRANPFDMIKAYIDTKDETTLNAAKNQVPIDLVLKLTNNLMKPDVDFDINFLSYNSNLKTIFDNLTTTMRNNENELNRQVFGIIVLNRFMPPIYSPLPNNNLNGNDAVNTVNDYLANQLTNYLSDWISSFISDVNFGVKYRQYTTSQNDKEIAPNVTDLRRELQLSISKKFYNNRIILNLGGNFDFGNGTTNVTNGTEVTKTSNYAGGDFELEYILSKDGNVRIRAFSKGQYDSFNSKAINRTGVGISLRKEFEDLNELRKNNLQNINYKKK